MISMEWMFAILASLVHWLWVSRAHIAEILMMSFGCILALILSMIMPKVVEAEFNQDGTSAGKMHARCWLVFAANVPLILTFLFVGDNYWSTQREKVALTASVESPVAANPNTQRKEVVPPASAKPIPEHVQRLIKEQEYQDRMAQLADSVKSIVAVNPSRMAQLVDYRLDAEWIVFTRDTMRLFREMGSDISEIGVIAADTLDDERVFLKFSEYEEIQEKLPLKKERFIWEITNEKRNYLADVFDKGHLGGSINDDSYELFYPYRIKGKTIILYASTPRHGKPGS
jgi:hypothetical protein